MPGWTLRGIQGIQGIQEIQGTPQETPQGIQGIITHPSHHAIPFSLYGPLKSQGPGAAAGGWGRHGLKEEGDESLKEGDGSEEDDGWVYDRRTTAF